ncbi:MAG: glutamine--tRNA ligase [Bacteroidetes bacterium GWE2_29_8]|nr:MAG: glutamine--tRNA ligase [Bacteroidetes bacterium GWE2_29_8]OFY19171.1 MAG: glutamine--tRNA ligase [Bacteroidetes bacterium GWF2_29_10]
MDNTTNNGDIEKKSLNFIENIIEEDIRNNKNDGRVHTRFPPEPNGYLHIGHAKSICLNFGLAKKYNGLCNLRFDDTNPAKEEVEYVDSIKEDVHWLGFDWEDREHFASDYFERLYEFAVTLIKKGNAFVCDHTNEEIANYRGTPTVAGKESLFINRTVEENLDLFERMRKGEFKDGEKVLRARIDMSSPNMHMRDPVIYRIRHVDHHRTGNKWCIYPMYDFTHCLSDSIEGITHSVCTLEFEVHRPLYDWFIEKLGLHHPQQIEFARLNINYTVMSKRRLLELVEQKYVLGWDDPRMPTICGLRRRGYTPESIRNFAEKVGVAKRENIIDLSLLEFCIREDLNKKTQRFMGVFNPLKLVITNCPDDFEDNLEAVNNPEDLSMGTRNVTFTKEIFIENDDFMENPPKKYFRLSPGNEVRLRYAYIVRCTDVIKDDKGRVVEVHCTYDPETRGGNTPDGRKVQGTIHWVSGKYAIEAEARLYDRLFVKENPDDKEEGQDYKANLNPHSLITQKCIVENNLKNITHGTKFQFERIGYFCVDKDSNKEKLVFNRTVTLKDSWSKIEKK